MGAADGPGAALGLGKGRVDHLLVAPVPPDGELLLAQLADHERRLVHAIRQAHTGHLLQAPLRPGARDEVAVAVGAAEYLLVLTQRARLHWLPGQGSPVSPSQRDLVDGAGGAVVLDPVDAPVPVLAVLFAPHDHTTRLTPPPPAREETLPKVRAKVEVLYAAVTKQDLARVAPLAVRLHLVHRRPTRVGAGGPDPDLIVPGIHVLDGHAVSELALVTIAAEMVVRKLVAQ
mmetsp:Transcript_38637/g.115408  ORF Transcript_38637/g.115408 Transcript_38637/m.115408 type:complete len:231 (+) Transcript_38637:1-693(+)